MGAPPDDRESASSGRRRFAGEGWPGAGRRPQRGLAVFTEARLTGDESASRAGARKRAITRVSVVARVAGRIIRLFGVWFLAPAAVAAGYGEWPDVGGFLAGGAAAGAVGQLLVGVSGRVGDDLRLIEALAVVAGVWLLLAPLCAVPYAWAGLGAIDALFESMSGITTTGATILTDFAAPGRGLFFWRSLTQWLGGMGVITLPLSPGPRLPRSPQRNRGKFLYLPRISSSVIVGSSNASGDQNPSRTDQGR